MKVSLEKEGVNIVKLALEIDSDKAMKAYNVACKQVSNRYNIPGFRRGKAPRNMVERLVGVDALKEEALRKLLPEVFDRVIVDEKLDIITQPEVLSYEFELDSPLKIQAQVEVRPEVQLGNYKGLSLKVPQAKLPADACDQALESLADARATLTTCDPRPSVLGDTVLMDFECSIDGKLVEGGKAEGLILELKPGNFLEGFCEQVVGLAPGDEKDVTATFPDSYRNKELAGKEGHFKVQVKEIRTRVKPEMNDEFAQSIGQESMEVLKKALLENLEREVKQENDARAHKAAVDAICADAKVDVPETMIDRETNLLLQQMKRYVEEKGGDWKEFIGQQDYPDIFKERKEEARQRVLTTLVLGAVVRAENMTVSAEEASPFLGELLHRYNVPVDRYDKDEEVRYAIEQLKRQAMEEALTRKLVEFLVGSASIEWTEDTEAQETEKAEPQAAEA